MPARSALSAAVLAVVIVMTTLTFGASLSALVSRPALYGWNWSYALASNQGPEAVPGQQVDGELRAAPGVAAWATVSYATADLDGQAVPVLLGDPGATVAPPILSGTRLPAGTRSCSAPPRWRRCTSTWAARCRSPSPGLACGSRIR